MKFGADGDDDGAVLPTKVSLSSVPAVEGCLTSSREASGLMGESPDC